MSHLSTDNIDDFLSGMDIWAWECDASFALTHLSDNFEEITGIPDNELIGLKLTDIANQLLPRSERAHFHNAIKNSQVIDHISFPWKANNGNLRWHDIYGYPVTSEGGPSSGYRGYGKSPKKLPTLNNTASTVPAPSQKNDECFGYWRFNLQDKLVFWCPRMYLMTGIPQSTGLTLERVLGLYSEQDRQKLIEAKKHAVETRSPFEVDLVCNKPDSGSIPICIEGFPQFSGNNLLGFEGRCHFELQPASKNAPRDRKPESVEVKEAKACQKPQQSEEAFEAETHPPKDDQCSRRDKMRNEFLLAIDQDQIVPVYQSVIDLKTGRLSGLECFARWQHPSKGLLSWGLFEDLFEDDQTLTGLGEKMLNCILQDMKRWNSESLYFGRVGYNVSDADLRDPNFADTAKRMLDDSGLRPRHLVLEISETAFQGPTRQLAVEQLNSLRRHGVSLAFRSTRNKRIDAKIHACLPFDILKIGNEIFQNDRISPSISQELSGLISQGKELGYSSVAEGVETQTQVNELKLLGCERAQGYFFQKPALADGVATKLVNLSSAA